MKPRLKPSHRIGIVLAASITLGWCIPLRAGEPGIDSISFERGCNGCADASVLVLKRDGAATLTVHGNARMGAAQQVLQGRIAPADFDALARLALAQGFFSMQDSYDDPTLRDGAWSTTGIVRGTQDKRVFVREDLGPAGIKQLAAAIGQARDAIAFRP